jgi:hypothetical protein
MMPTTSRRYRHATQANEAPSERPNVRNVRDALIRMPAAVALALAASACTVGEERSAEMPRPASESAVFAVLADRTLVQVSPTSRKLTVRRSLGPRSPLAGFGRFLALSGDSRQLFVLTPSAPGKGQEVRILDRVSLRLIKRVPLEGRAVFRVIAVGSRTGLLYLFGNRPVGRGAEDAVVALLDAEVGKLRTTIVRHAAGHDWWIFDGAVSPDESRLYVSYHGGCGPKGPELCTSGADWITVAGVRLVRCARRSIPGNGCLVRVHGGVEAVDGGALGASGEGPIFEISDSGSVVAAQQTRLPGNHLMEFALDGRRERVYAVGQCYYTGGVSVLDLSSQRTRVLSHEVCGERIAIGGQLVAVAEQARADPLGVPSRIALVDAATGSTSYVTVPIETLDLLVVSPN